MSERDRAFLERLRKRYGGGKFVPADALDDFHLSELPEDVLNALVTRGPVSTVRALTGWLQEIGAEPLPGRTKRGRPWRLP